MDGNIKARFFGKAVLFFAAIITIIALWLQYWYGEMGHNELKSLQKEVEAQRQTNAVQQQQNEVLRADVSDLKSELSAVEEHARLDLGLIKPNETFVQLSTAPVVQSQIADDSSEDDAVETEDVPLIDTPVENN